MSAITLQEIHTRLVEIHDDFCPVDTEQWDAEFAKGNYHPCGCQICLLLEDIFMATMPENETQETP